MTSSAPARSAKTTPSGGKTVGKELADFLIEFSIAVHRYSMYPSDHPSLGPAAVNVMARLARLLAERQDLTIGVAHRQLVIDGLATEQKHPVLSDLANRLRDNHIGAITFSQSVGPKSLQGLLEALAEAAEAEDDPIGLRERDQIPSWPGLKIFAVGYEDLKLDKDGKHASDEQVLQLWLGLARAAMAGTPAGAEWLDEDFIPEPSVVAAGLQGTKQRAYDEVIVSYLLQITEQLADGDKASEPLQQRISELLSKLDRVTLQRMLRMGGDAERRRRMVQHAFKGLGGDVALKLLETAAATSGQEISVLMVRMLTKLSFHADGGAADLRPQAARVVEETIDELMEGWNVDDPNPEGYVRILDELSRTSPYLKRSTNGIGFKGSALAIVKMSLEVDTYGDMVDQALDELLAKGGLPLIHPLLEEAEASDTAQKIRGRVASPDQIEALVDFEQVSEESFRLLVDLVGPQQAVTPLLRLLAESEARSLRRSVFDRLVEMNDHIGRSIAPFLEDPRWYVVRNMLELVAALPERPQGFNSMRYVSHVDLRVRRAALPLALAEPENRAKALTVALRETDERMVRTGLLELRAQLPHGIVPLVVSRCLNNDELPPAVRALAASVLEQAHEPSVRDALIEVASGGRTLLGGAKLASLDGPEGDLTRAAFAVLFGSWSDDPAVQPLIKAAKKTRNPAVQAILEGDVPRPTKPKEPS